MLKTQRTLSLIKPDVSSNPQTTATIIMRYIDRGLTMVRMKQVQMNEIMFEWLYGEHKGKPFYEPMKKFYTSGPMFAFIWEGKNAIDVVRRLNGATDPAEAKPGTIRRDFGSREHEPGMTFANAVHGSKDESDFKKELSIFFY